MSNSSNYDPDADRAFIRFCVKVGVGIVLCVVAVIALAMWGLPKYRLYRADIEKQTEISEARAHAEAADYTAKAEVTKANYEAKRDRIRAQGVADANKIIAASLTPEYITWHYIDQLTDHQNQLIYVPTEGGIPILEAGRMANIKEEDK